MLTTLLLCVAPALPQQAEEQLRAWAQALAPSYLHGQEPDPAAATALVRFLLDGGLHAVAELPDADLARHVMDRLSPNLRQRDLAALADELIGETLEQREAVLELLRKAPFREAGADLERLILSGALTPAEMLPLVDRVLAAGGRPALLRLRPLLTPEQHAAVLRSIYFHWRPVLVDDDLELLQQLVEEGPSMCSEYALQTWAGVERRPEQRLRLFELADLSERSNRTKVLHLLAQSGRDAALSQRVRSMLDVPSLDDQTLALDLLAFVAGPEALLEEWQRRDHAAVPLTMEGRWMTRLARTALPEARSIAAHWFVNGGWQVQRRAASMVRALGFDPVIDPLLDGFLSRSEVPLETRLHLAMERAGGSPEARAFLRQAAPEATSLRQGRIAALLGRAPDDDDLRWLTRVSRDEGFADSARAEAVRGLARHPGGVVALLALLHTPPQSYEVADSLAHAVVMHGDEDLRRRGLAAVATGFGRWQGAGRASLQRSAWMAQERRPDPFEAEALLAQWLAVLAAAPDPYADDHPWPEPRQVRRAFTDLPVVTRAFAASLSMRWVVADLGCLELQQAVGAASLEASTEALWVAARAALGVDPHMALELAHQAAARPGLHPQVRIRALGLEALVAQRWQGAARESAALQAVIDDFGADLAADGGLQVNLGYGLDTPSPRGWLLPLDEVLQRLILARSGLAQSVAELDASLRPLLSGGCTVPVLLQAAERALEMGAAALATEMAWRAFDFEPESAQARLLLGRAQLELGEDQAARIHLGHALRLAPQGSPVAQHAEEQMQALSSRPTTDR